MSDLQFNNINNIIPVFFAVDDSYASYMAVALKSMLDNANQEYNYKIYVLTDSLNEYNIKSILALQTEYSSIEIVDVNAKLQESGKMFHMRDYYSAATYYRFFIPEMFPQYSKGIYLDCDIVVISDISQLFKNDLNNKLVAGVTDEIVTDIEVFGEYVETVLGVERNKYFNAGILLLNLEELRKFKIEKKLYSLIGKYKFTVAQDQDYLNVLCNGKILYLNKLWNKTAFPDSAKDILPNIIHFKINFKPWHYSGVAFEKYFWNYAKQTDYYKTLLNEKESYSDEEKLIDKGQYDNLVKLANSEIEKSKSADYINPLSYLIANKEI